MRLFDVEAAFLPYSWAFFAPRMRLSSAHFGELDSQTRASAYPRLSGGQPSLETVPASSAESVGEFWFGAGRQVRDTKRTSSDSRRCGTVVIRMGDPLAFPLKSFRQRHCEQNCPRASATSSGSGRGASARQVRATSFIGSETTRAAHRPSHLQPVGRGPTCPAGQYGDRSPHSDWKSSLSRSGAKDRSAGCDAPVPQAV